MKTHLGELTDRMDKFQAITEWANTADGMESRATLAHFGFKYSPTAEDVLALLEPELAAKLRTDLGMEEMS